ncbi:MAG: alpha/beta hydrolase, partial [Verrucomicrobia bacterium]|nr:alpha/beta hydrolase [Verrucomicrobiota bacterium]
MASNTDTIFDTPTVLGVIFHPRSDARPNDEKDFQIPIGDGVSLGARLHISANNDPLLLFFHGNGEIASDYDDIAPTYNGMGLNLLIVDYRGYGRSGGTPTVATLLSDAKTVFQQLPALLEANGMAPAALYIMGRSLGSACAIEIASQVGNGIAALIIESGFAYPVQLIERLGGGIIGASEDSGKGPLGALSKMATIQVPTLIIHGQRDWIIPITDAHALHYHAGAKNKKLVT